MLGLTEDTRPAIERYQSALGQFIHDFTILELFIFSLLCAAAGVTDEIGRAIFSGTRADQMISLIKRCFEVREREIPEFLNRAFLQAGVLNKARNEVVHFVTMSIEDDDDAVYATSTMRTIASKAKELTIQPEALEAMAQDARILPAMFNVAMFEITEPESVTGLSDAMREPFPAWHYIPATEEKPHRRR